ncbi:hypothetical protein BDZ97DRAFT_1065327 [Flammula alnicola]|nr:hypothetical protein BDZ97DRAFT_1065327 [Flammula alnicola]
MDVEAEVSERTSRERRHGGRVRARAGVHCGFDLTCKGRHQGQRRSVGCALRPEGPLGRSHRRRIWCVGVKRLGSILICESFSCLSFWMWELAECFGLGKYCSFNDLERIAMGVELCGELLPTERHCMCSGKRQSKFFLRIVNIEVSLHHSTCRFSEAGGSSSSANASLREHYESHHRSAGLKIFSPEN